MPDERALRKPTFQEGHPVVLADNQAWTLPKPYIRLIPKVADDGTVDVDYSRSWGPEHDDAIEVIFGRGEGFDSVFQSAPGARAGRNSLAVRGSREVGCEPIPAKRRSGASVLARSRAESRWNILCDNSL